MKSGVFCAFFLLLLFQASYADIYKYVDGNGVVVFTDSLPPHMKPEAAEAPSAKKAPARAPRLPETGPSEVVSAGSDYHSIIQKHCDKYNIDSSLIKAVIKTESNFNAGAVSRKGAMGLMQLMPSTAYELGVIDPFDPDENIEAGVRYLKYLLMRFDGDLKLAVAAYNAGPEPVQRHKDVPPISETKNYVKKVFSLYKGKTSMPQNSTRATFYRVVLDDGSVLFTNSLPPRKSTQKL